MSCKEGETAGDLGLPVFEEDIAETSEEQCTDEDEHEGICYREMAYESKASKKGHEKALCGSAGAVVPHVRKAEEREQAVGAKNQSGKGGGHCGTSFCL